MASSSEAKNKILIRGGHVVDAASGLDGVMDILIEGSQIAQIGPDLEAGDAEVVNAEGLTVTPGLIDMHVHLREPGKAEEETIASGALAAVCGGITSVAAFPNTDPVIDNAGGAEFVVLQAKRAHGANVFPVGAVTQGLQGEQLAEMAGLAEAGAVAFSDADRAIESAEIFRRGLLYARMLKKVVITHCEDRHLRGGGVMNNGSVSVQLGLSGIPNAAEDIMVARDITLAQITGAQLHISQMSTQGSVEGLRRAKARDLPVSGDVTPHHFTLNHEEVKSFDSCFKMIPPLRAEEDVREIKKGLADGTIEVIASGHAPHASEEKDVEFDSAPFGVIGMETLFSVSYSELVLKEGLTFSTLLSKLTTNPAKLLGLYPKRGALKVGSKADISVFDLDTQFQIDSKKLRSKSSNCPFHGKTVQGKAIDVFVGGRPVVRGGEPSV